MDPKQHLLSDDNESFTSEAHDQLQATSDGDRYHCFHISYLRYHLPRLHLWTYIYLFILHLALVLTLIMLTTKIGLFTSVRRMGVSSYCKSLDTQKSSLMKVQPLY